MNQIYLLQKKNTFIPAATNFKNFIASVHTP